MSEKKSVAQTLLTATLKSLLAFAESSAWIKAGGTFIAELADRSGSLTKEQKEILYNASDTDLREALLQLDLAAKYSAFTAAGIVRIEDQVATLRTAIEEADTPTIIKFPGVNVTQKVNGDGNIVTGSGDIHIAKIDMRRTRARSIQTVLPGTVGTNAYKTGYLQYLAKRYNKLKEGEAGKAAMKYGFIYVAYEREMKFSIKNTPLDRFDQGAEFLQNRIRNTIIGRTQAPKGNRLFQTFDEFVNHGRNPDPTMATP